MHTKTQHTQMQLHTCTLNKRNGRRFSALAHRDDTHTTPLGQWPQNLQGCYGCYLFLGRLKCCCCCCVASPGCRRLGGCLLLLAGATWSCSPLLPSASPLPPAAPLLSTASFPLCSLPPALRDPPAAAAAVSGAATVAAAAAINRVSGRPGCAAAAAACACAACGACARRRGLVGSRLL